MTALAAVAGWPDIVTPPALCRPHVRGAFRARCVIDGAELASLFRMRHQVYRVDMGLSADSDDGGASASEQDAYDARSVHIACFHQSGSIAGYVRLIYGSPELPTLMLYDLGGRYRERSAEVSRLIVAPEHRGSELVSRLIRSMLADLIRKHANANGVASLFSFGRPAVFTVLGDVAGSLERIEGARPVNLHRFGKMYRDFFARGEVVPMRMRLIEDITVSAG